MLSIPEEGSPKTLFRSFADADACVATFESIQGMFSGTFSKKL